MRGKSGSRWPGIALFALGSAALLVLAALAHAQAAQYTFRRTVRRVVVDVVVTDEHHNLIHGLKKGDFRLYEDNREQGATRQIETIGSPHRSQT